MKKSIIIIIIITGIISCQESVKSKTPDYYKLSKDTINFGVINYNDTFYTKEKIINQSEGPLKVVNIESSCGCTTLLIKDSVIKGFDYSEFAISYIPSHSFDSGKVLKRLTIRTDAKQAFKNLIVIGEVKK